VTPLGDADRAALLRLARAAIRHRLSGGPAPESPSGGALGEQRGAFVTLRRNGELRGCVGTLAARDPLVDVVRRMAVSAATEDPRFEPIADGELEGIRISISALSELRPLRGPEELVVGRDGVVVQRGWHRGTLLPVVAVEHGWSAEELLRHTCLKAGLPPTAWEDGETVLETFSAEEFGE
jgi:AmmeMemoRadiSam system protein A